MQALLEYKIPDNPRLAMLVRLFHFGETLAWQEVSALLPAAMLEAMIDCRMLGREGETVGAECMLAHFGELLLASDSVQKIEGEHLANLVLSVSTSMTTLARALITRENSAALDLGTGCGALALLLARSSRKVCATDINPRALAFTKFNAALNGATNVSTRCGDRFEPVLNEGFDRIVSNPPFFLGSKQRLLFTDNPMELDSFVESLARAAPTFLNEGGFFQMICEWVECGPEPWKDRLAGWFKSSGCDVLVLKAYEVAPADYVLKRAAEAASFCPEESGEALRKRMEYFERKQVRKICGGLLTMRRRAAKNWMVFDEMDETPEESTGAFLLERFVAEDVLASHDGRELLRLKPRVAKGVRLVEQAAPEGGGWKATRRYLERPGSLSRRLAVEPDIAELIGGFDGKQTLEAIVARITRKSKLPATQVVDVALQVVANLAGRGLIEFANE